MSTKKTAKDPDTVPIRGDVDHRIVGHVPIKKILEIDGFRGFALHRCFYFPKVWRVTEMRSGGSIATGKTQSEAISRAKMRARAAVKKHGSMKKALAWGYRRLKRLGVQL